jgi:hypothetical protein
MRPGDDGTRRVRLGALIGVVNDRTRQICSLRKHFLSFGSLALPESRPFITRIVPFIVKSCPGEGFHVIDVTGFSTACFAKIALKFSLKYEIQRSRFEGSDSTAKRG